MSPWTIGFIGLLVGVIGTGLGSLIGIFIKKTDKISSFMFGLTGGFMLFIVGFHLLPEAFKLGGIFPVLSGVVIGVFIIIFIESILDRLQNYTSLRTGLILGLSIAIHNFPEGLAIGSSLKGVTQFGYILTLAMLLHNIPEGISMALPLSFKKVQPWKIMLFSILVGVPTGIGAYLGAYLGNISTMLIALSLAVAGGIMLYIVCDDLIPEGKLLSKGRVSSIATIIGFLLGIVLYFK